MVTVKGKKESECLQKQQQKRKRKKQYILNQFPSNHWLPNRFNKFTQKVFEQNFN